MRCESRRNQLTSAPLCKHFSSAPVSKFHPIPFFRHPTRFHIFSFFQLWRQHRIKSRHVELIHVLGPPRWTRPLCWMEMLEKLLTSSGFISLNTLFFNSFNLNHNIPINVTCWGYQAATRRFHQASWNGELHHNVW